MLKRTLALLGLGAAAAMAAPDPLLYEPMFCDRPELYRATASAAPWQALLFGSAAEPAAVRALAADPAADSRVRALAFGWLRQRQQPVPRGELLGVVFEVEVAGGLDVLAVYADGRLRYLHHAGRVALFDALPPAMQSAWAAVMSAARQASVTAQPWLRRGGALPGPGDVRLGFVRSDGLHLRQGRFEDLQRDAAAGPLLLAGAQLLQQVTQVLR